MKRVNQNIVSNINLEMQGYIITGRCEKDKRT